jgi:hypothetical protein
MVPLGEPEVLLEVDEQSSSQVAEAGINAGLMTPNQVRPKSAGVGLLVGGVIGLLAVMLLCCGVFAFFIGSLPKPPPRTPEQIAADKQSAQDRSDGRRMVREIEAIVSKRLKAPTTAKFALTCNIQRFGTETIAVIAGTVTSQNEFSAMLTKPVKAMYIMRGEQYKLISYMFEDDNLVLDQGLLDLAIKAMQETQKK